jgi:methylmalonyl-CoA/ethylmalonyl-CoA epimerase
MFAAPGIGRDSCAGSGVEEERMTKVDHVGIAVNALSESVPLFEALLGAPPSGLETIGGEGVRVAFFGDGPGRVELLEPTSPDTPLGRFLERRGPGLHHLCIAVRNLDAALARARERGIDPLPPGVRSGAGGRRVAFLHPRSTGGVLLELTEPGGSSDDGEA